MLSISPHFTDDGNQVNVTHPEWHGLDVMEPRVEYRFLWLQN